MKIIINKGSAAAALTGVWFGYPQRPVFEDVTLSITGGALTAVVGPNGSGKSTLLGLLAGVLNPTRGSVDAPTEVAFAVQRSLVTDTFPITAGQAVMMGRWRRLGLLRRPSRHDRDTVEHWLTELKLQDVRGRTLGELSSGQRQRVLLAQVFAQEAPLLLLDEPTTGLDAATGTLVIAHLEQVARRGGTVVVATHDPTVIRAADARIDLGEVARH